MNRLRGNIADIQTSGHMSIVSVSVSTSLTLRAIVVETPDTADYLTIGNTILVLFKETEVVIATQATDSVSLRNRIPCTIAQIDKGVLLSKLSLSSEKAKLTAIISTEAVVDLGLVPNTKVTALVKLNEMMLSEL